MNRTTKFSVFKKAVIGFTVMVMSSAAYAAGGTDVGIFFGAKNADFDIDQAGVSTSAKTGLMAGVVAYGEMSGMAFRTGGYYTERNSEVKASTVKADLKFSYIDIPVTVMYSFNDMLSVFGGAVLALKVSDKCSGDASICSGTNEPEAKSFYSALTVGLNAKFHPNWSGEVFYEHGLSKIATETDANAISLAAVFIY